MVRSLLRAVFCLLFLFPVAILNAQSKVSMEGYVTHLDPSASFHLNQRLVITTPSTTFGTNVSTSTLEVPFSLGMLSPGKYVLVHGTEDKQTHVITAKEIETVDGGSIAHRSGRAWEDRAPALIKEGSGWRGTVYVDGYEIAVDSKTTVQLAPGMADTNVFRPDLRVSYDADRQKDATLLAKSIVFAEDEHLTDEQEYRKNNDFKIELPDYDKNEPGKVHFFLKTYHILPNHRLQEAINNFGQKLVPEWQRNLPDSDPAKIHFRFFVIEKARSMQRTASNDSGTILIPSQIIPKLQNEAQLAALLAADIAVAIENDIYRSRTRKYSQAGVDIAMAAVPFGAGIAGQAINDGTFSASYWTPLIDHEYRVGLRYMVGAGYDPREAPIALQRLVANHPDKTEGKPLPTLAKHVDAELGFDYMGLDFSSLHKGETECASLVKMTYAADPKLNHSEKSHLAD